MTIGRYRTVSAPRRADNPAVGVGNAFSERSSHRAADREAIHTARKNIMNAESAVKSIFALSEPYLIGDGMSATYLRMHVQPNSSTQNCIS